MTADARRQTQRNGTTRSGSVVPRATGMPRRSGTEGHRADAGTAPGDARSVDVPTPSAAAATMRAAWCPRYGGPESLEIRELPRPAPAAGELLVRVHVSAVTAADTMIRRGTPFYGRAFLGFVRPRHPIPGTGFAGTVEALGEGVTNVEVGTAVFGETTLGFSANAEYLTVPADGVVLPKPGALSFEEAAVACDGAMTALCLMEDTAKLRSGERLLVVGAAGAQGSAAVQIGERLGAHVTAVASAANAEFVASLGAHAVIDYGTVDFAATGERWDVIYDTVGARRFSEARVALTEGGRYVSGVLSLGLLAGTLWSARVGRRRALFAATGLRPAGELRERLGRVADMIVEGQLRLPIERRYPLAAIADAHRHVEGGHKRGNLVIEMLDRAERDAGVGADS